MKTNYEKLMKTNYEKLLIFYLPFTATCGKNTLRLAALPKNVYFCGVKNTIYALH